jgi:hypothetical protein
LAAAKTGVVCRMRLVYDLSVLRRFPMKHARLAFVLLACVLIVQFVSAFGDHTFYGYGSCSKSEPANATQSHREWRSV